MKTTARLTHDKVRFDQSRDLHLVASLEAPSLRWQEQRPRVCIIPVIDVSGSMQGPKLHHAKQSVLKLIDHLAPGDLCGVVTFTDEVATLAPPLEMAQARKDALKAAVGQLEPQGSTNFAGGLLAGLEHAARAQVPAGMVKRVIMFTDGLPNVGVATKGSELLPLLEAHLGEATVSAFGYGEDADQELLRDLAARGKGNYAFVRNPEDALAAFARELGGLLSTYARDVELVVRPAAGARLVDVVSDVDAREEGGAVRIRIPDVLSEEVRHVVLGVHLDATAAPGRAPVALVEGRYVVVDADTRRSREERFELPVEVERVLAGQEQVAATVEVDQVVALAQLVRAQIDAEVRARSGDFREAQRIVHALLGSLRSRGRDAAAEACERILGSVADGAAYQASSAFRTSFRKGATRGASSMIDADAAVLLRKAGVQTSTSGQDEMVKSFGASGASGAGERPRRNGGRGTGKVPGGGKSLTRKRSRRW
ncbi:MAG TPA: VWA domain-containing protein [Anaeromyxobacteraceae bacterium]|nr:VWA domain-containing protein [Anaeromyxobacteraceae bacterium]